MYKLICQKKCLSLILFFLLIFSSAVIFVPGTVFADDGPKQLTGPFEKIFIDKIGRQIVEAAFPLPPPEIVAETVTVPDVHIAGEINTLSDVPAFDWTYGCSATSAAMLFGYYDRSGYSNMYTGPAGDGICPLDNSVWGHTNYPHVTCGESPLSATHNGIDGRTIKGHVDDYWVDYGSTAPDPYIGHWTEHIQGDCTGDYMGTNQSMFNNTDGSTIFFWYSSGDPLYDYTGYEPFYRDGCHGMRLFAQSRGYKVLANFTQAIKGQANTPFKGFTFSDFQAEIDAGRPVLIQLTGHTMLGYGYNTTGNIIYVHNTWDYGNHQMTWGGSYYGMQQRAVTVIRLQSQSELLQVTTPTFSPPAGTYNSPQNVSIFCSTSGATIRYTTNGSEPTSLSPVFSSPLTISITTTLKAKAFKSGMTDSTTATATYIINQPVATPTFSPPAGTYTSPQSVSILCSTSGATIRYTTNGSEPTSLSPVYSSPLTVSNTTTLKARAFKGGMSDSTTATATYTINLPMVATPTFSPPAGTYTSPQSVSILCSTSGATIRYTTNGSEPTSLSPVYSSPLTVSSTTTLKARAFKSGMSDSTTAAAAYTIKLPMVATPIFSPPAGTYTSPQSVSISCSTSGATIRYTTNGSEPTSLSPVYSSPLTVSSTTTLKAKAFKSGMSDSTTALAAYIIIPRSQLPFKLRSGLALR